LRFERRPNLIGNLRGDTRRAPLDRVANFDLAGGLQRCEGVSCAVDDPVCIGRQIDITAVQNAQLEEECVADIDPYETVCVTACGVGQHPRITRVGLGEPAERSAARRICSPVT
jgi:hypothetical protein